MSVAHVPLGLIPGPFHDRLLALSRTQNWVDWAGYLSPGRARHGGVRVFRHPQPGDAVRHLADAQVPHHRPGRAEAMLNRLVTRNVAKIGDGRVGYVMWCDEEGMLIDDGTLFRTTSQDFRLCCQEPMYSWLLDAAWGFDVEITDESHTVAALSLQGPTSWSVLKDAGIDVSDLKPFDWREVEDRSLGVADRVHRRSGV